MFQVGEFVRINEGRHYGRCGVIQSKRGFGYDATYTVAIANVGIIETTRVISPTANNGE